MIIAGICGGSCSGKSTVVAGLTQKIEKLTVLHFDDFFVGKEKIAGLKITNFEDPELYRLEDYVNTLKKLRSGKSVEIEANSRESRHEGLNHRQIKPNDFVIVEGFLTFYPPESRKYFDKKIYLDIPEEEIIRRRYERMENGGGQYSDEYIKKTLIEEHNKNVVPQKQFADIIVDATQKPEEMVEKIYEYLLK